MQITAPDSYYVSPFDLRDEDGKAVVESLADESQPTMDFSRWEKMTGRRIRE
jgi:hypothetical protein